MYLGTNTLLDSLPIKYLIDFNVNAKYSAQCGLSGSGGGTERKLIHLQPE